jgi:hypothetical protein
MPDRSGPEEAGMTIREFCDLLDRHPGTRMHWMLPDRSFVPAHYHITEVGRLQKDFIDCGVELTPSGLLFHLGTKHTACLAPEKCGVDGTGCC